MDLEQGFRILGLGRADDTETGRRAWRALVRRWHPDRFARNPAMRTLAEERIKEINRAWALVAPHLPPAPRQPAGGTQKADHFTDSGVLSFRPGLKRLLRRIRLRRILREIFSSSHRTSPKTGQDATGIPKKRRRVWKEKSFDEVFEEVSGADSSGCKSDPEAATDGRPARRSTARHRPPGNAGTVDGINGVEGVDPIDAPGRPGRVRGIGRDR